MTRPAVPLRPIPFEPVRFDDLAGWFASERGVAQWGGTEVSHPLDVGRCQAMLDEGRGDPPVLVCLMAARDDRLGRHAQLRFDWRNGNAALWRIGIAPDWRGRGFAAPVVRLVMDEAVARSGIERLELNIYSWDTPALRTYRRLGFAAEGVRRPATRVGAERWDTAVTGLLRAEWEAARAAGA